MQQMFDNKNRTYIHSNFTRAHKVEMALGDVELERLQELLALGDDGAEGGQGWVGNPFL